MALPDMYCPNCFQIIQNRQKCPYCGFDRFVKSNSMALDDNTLLDGRYLVGRVLGSGGFGITYKAYDIKRKRICAIKEYVPLGMVSRTSGSTMLILSEQGYGDQFDHGKKRFMDEANVLKSLDYNPVVAKIFDYFYENGTSYFVMEYVDGYTLSQLLNKHGGKIPYEELIHIIIQVSEGLDVVHTKSNLFHRDISPDNILVKKNGEIRLIDFGNAKFISNMENQNLSIVLKQGYAPLEQYSSTSKQGAYTDVYALASTFYYCLTGVKVPTALSRLSMDKLMPIDYYMGPQFKDLSDIFHDALQIRHENRTQTARAFINEIRYFNETHGFSEPKKQPVYEGGKAATEVSQNPPVKYASKVAYLYGIHGPVKGQLYKLPANVSITIGRSSDCQIRIEQAPSVSRRHLDIFYDSAENLFYLENFSRNGTVIDQLTCEIGKCYWMMEGTILSLSNNACVFQIGVLNE